MKLFSGRGRPGAAGPWPTELLPRTVWSPNQDLDVGSEPSAGSSGLLQSSIAPVRDVFVACRKADVAPAPAPMPSPEAAVDNLKGYCFFLDADIVGISEIDDRSWTAEAIEGHTHALSVLVASGREARADEPGAAWIEGQADDVASLRALEIVTVVARYIAALGHATVAHGDPRFAAGDVDGVRLAVAAGVLEVRNGRPTHPFLRRGTKSRRPASKGYGLATITMAWDLPTDAPLARRSRLQTAKVLARQQLGFGGTRPGWDRLNGSHRDWCLGRYPMEKVPRVDEPTTLILEDEVQRVSSRNNFFVRARAGDLGPRPQREVARFIPKAPHGMAASDLLNRLVELQFGVPDAEARPTAEDPTVSAQSAKALGHFLGADMVGVCRAPEYAWYSHHPDGTPIEARHPNAIVFVLDQGFDTMEGASGDDWISGAQSMRAYLRSSMIACTLAAHLRSLGWEAQAHTARHDEINHIPLLLNAGIGELSRIGELVLNPFVGPRFKSGVVTTNVPMTPDKPIDFGLQDFCTKCTKCARECPCGAIRFGDKVMFNGYEMWKPDVDRCARYRVTNMRGSACGRCMKTCPYNVEGVMAERPFQWAAIRLPFTRRWLAQLDDRLGRGSINPVKKWWVDVEMVDGTPVEPPKGANARELQLDRRERDADAYALFPPALAPDPEDGMAPAPVDRKAGLAAAAAAETPAGARLRRGRPRGE